jgi:hypothetical protein
MLQYPIIESSELHDSVCHGYDVAFAGSRSLTTQSPLIVFGSPINARVCVCVCVCVSQLYTCIPSIKITTLRVQRAISPFPYKIATKSASV